MSNLFIFSYLFANIFNVFCAYLFYKTFLEKRNKKRGLVLCCVLSYIIVATERLWINIPLLTLFTNIIFDAIQTSFYESSIRRRFVGIAFCNAIFVLSESIYMAFTGYIAFSLVGKGTYTSEAGMFCYPILPLIFTLLYRQRKKSKGDIRFPMSYCIIVVCVPLSCIYIVLLLFSFRGIQEWQLISATVILFAMFSSVLLLYEKQMKFYSEENKRQVLEVQNSYYRKQMEYMISTENATRSLRHDIKNHLMSITSLAKKNDSPAVIEYIDKLYHYFQPLAGSVSSGNVVVDSILNGKLALATEKGIKVNMNVSIPVELSIHDVDITILLGNLLDNAIENFDNEAGNAVELDMKYDKGRLFIRLTNPYSGMAQKGEGDFRTRKEDKKNHGFGLQNVHYVVDKYDGEIKIEKEGNVFLVEILLYLTETPKNISNQKMKYSF